MLTIPPTSPKKYLSGIVALNIHSPKGTGDWHCRSVWDAEDFSEEHYVFGEDQEVNTNHLFMDKGIIDGTERLKKMGIFSSNNPVWVADHPRACVDYLYIAVLKRGVIGGVVLEEWFPNQEDKEEVYEILRGVEGKLNNFEKKNLELWKKQNPIE